jgi:hypothetical protein
MKENIKKILKTVLKQFLVIIDNIIYSDSDESDFSKKIRAEIIIPTNSDNLDNSNELEILTDGGWRKVLALQETQVMSQIRIKTRSYYLEAADTHIVYGPHWFTIPLNKLVKGDFIMTRSGLEEVLEIQKSNKGILYDLSVDWGRRRYWTNGILSHNTVTSAISILHYCMFNNQKNVMIAANKLDTVKEIINKIKDIYKYLPFHLQAGVKTWNEKAIVFDNDTRIKTQARSKEPAIGFSVDFLYMDEFAHIPQNIIEPFYRAIYPTVTSIANHKIVITSTPNGKNLFHKIFTHSELPKGHPDKMNYTTLRIPWHRVPNRNVTYIRTEEDLLEKWGLDRDDISTKIEKEGFRYKKAWNADRSIWEWTVFNNVIADTELIEKWTIETNTDIGFKEIALLEVAEISSWMKEAIKDINGIENFKQEYDIQFITSGDTLINNDDSIKIEALLEDFVPIDFDKLVQLGPIWEKFTWTPDTDRWDPNQASSYHYVIAVDPAEGVGRDFSVINIFKMTLMSEEDIESAEPRYWKECVALDQIGIFRSNTNKISDIARLLYILVYEIFNPEQVRVVLEMNKNLGDNIILHMKDQYDGDNDFSTRIFFKYKHTQDSTVLKPGLLIQGNNKAQYMAELQDCLKKGRIITRDKVCYNELISLVRKDTPNGSKYVSSTGNDDQVMTLLQVSSVFSNPGWKSWVEQWVDEGLDSNTIQEIENYLYNSDN